MIGENLVGSIKGLVSMIKNGRGVIPIESTEGIADKARELELAANNTANPDEKLELLRISIDCYIASNETAKAALLLEKLGWASEGESRKRYFQKAISFYGSLPKKPDEDITGKNKYLGPDEKLYLLARLESLDGLKRLSELQTTTSSK